MLKFLLASAMLGCLVGMGLVGLLVIGYQEEGQGLHPVLGGAVWMALMVLGTVSAKFMGDAE